MDLDVMGKGLWGRVGEGESIIRIYFMKIIYFKLKTNTCGTINNLLYFERKVSK